MHGSRGPLVALGAAIALAAAPTAAVADRDDHTRPAPFDRWDRGLFFAGHGASVAGISGGGFGLAGEVARGHGRWQLFGDASLMWTTLAVSRGPIADGAAMAAAPAPAADVEGADGFETRLGLGGRRLLRAFEPDHSAAIELFAEGGVGVSRIWWNGGGTLTRPDVFVGVGWQVRGFETPLLAIRMAVKVIVQAPVDDDATAGLCQGTCPLPGHHGADPGFVGQIGVAW